MEQKTVCLQCEQTAGCSGNAGVCGKSADAARLQDELTGALIGLARATDNAPYVNDGTWRLMIEGLFATVTNVSFDTAAIRALLDRVHAEKARLVPNCAPCAAPCGRTGDYDMAQLWARRRTSAASNPWFSSACAGWRPTPTAPWCSARPTRP